MNLLIEKLYSCPESQLLIPLAAIGLELIASGLYTLRHNSRRERQEKEMKDKR